MNEKAKRALILTADGFEDSELFYPYYRLQEAGVRVDVAGPKAGALTGKVGYVFQAQLSFADVRPADYDVLVLPGGKAPEAVRQSELAVGLARTMFEAGKGIAAICHGPQVLISAGVLRGRKATSYRGIRDDMVLAGADYVDAEVVVDGKLVTSRTPADLPAFGRELARLVTGD